MSADAQATQMLERYWQTGGEDTAVAKDLRGLVCTTPPGDAFVAGRCLPVLRALDNPGAWADRVDDYANHVARLVRRLHQIDQLGDPDTEPTAVFEILGDEADAVDMSSFDAERLTQSRMGKASRAAAARAFLETLGTGSLPAYAADELAAAADALTRRGALAGCAAMFAADSGTGLVLGVSAAPADGGKVVGYSRADEAMKTQAEAVLARAFEGRGATWGVEWEVSFGGSSIGLGLYIAAQVALGRFPEDPLLAATGRIDATGRVCGVGHIPEKARAAASGGYRRLLVPADDADTAVEAVAGAAGITVVPVEHVDELVRALARISDAAAIGVDGTVRMVRKLAPLYGLDLTGERLLDNGYRLEVADASSSARIDVFSGRRANVKPTGNGTALKSAQLLVQERLPRARVEPRSSVTVLVPTEARRDRLRAGLERAGAVAVDTKGQYEVFRYRLADAGSEAVVIGYTTNKVQVQAGQAPAHDRAAAVVREAVDGLSGVPASPAPTAPAVPPGPVAPHIGTDEAGKGDYFGPLVCAACYVDAASAEALRVLGVRDSKTLSDKAIARLAAQIKETAKVRWSIVPIRPAKYNELYAQFRREGQNLNSLVAWGHVRGIQNLFNDGIWAEYAVIDKFADDRYIRDRLAKDSRQGAMRLDQRTKAESDIAVAAASILARDAFVRWIDETSAALGMTLPKGAGDQVIAAARALVAARGPEALNEYAKVPFKTTAKVLAP